LAMCILFVACEIQTICFSADCIQLPWFIR
jgi:hypothetical protein